MKSFGVIVNSEVFWLVKKRKEEEKHLKRLEKMQKKSFFSKNLYRVLNFYKFFYTLQQQRKQQSFCLFIF